MVGNLKVGDQIRQTSIRIRNMEDFEAYINASDEVYDAEDSILNGYIYKINTPQLKKLNPSHYGNGCDFEQEIFEYRPTNCFITIMGIVSCDIFLTGKDYKQQYLEVIRSEQRRSNFMTKARIQPFC